MSELWQWAVLQYAQLPVTNPVLVFAILMLVILFAPMLAERLRVPGLIGLILTGLVVGPNTLNLIERGDAMKLFGSVGLLYIMFVAGLEINLRLFNQYKLHSGLFGFLTFILPQGIGMLVGYYVLGMTWPVAILLASMFASHTLVPYTLMGRFGILKNRAVVSTVGGTLITDTAALLVLAIIAAGTVGELNQGYWIKLGLSIAVFMVIVLYVLPRVGQRFFRTVGGEGPAEFLFVLAAVFTCAYFAELAGIEPIVGAFLAGLALNRLVPDHSPLMNRIQFVGNVLFIPMFLISVGMLVDLRVLWGQPRALLVSAAMVVTVIVTKWLAARSAQWLLGYTRAEGMVMFGLSVNQAAATLAAVFVGVRIGLFDEAVLNGAIMMILATCMLGPWVTEKYGRKVALQEEPPVKQGDAPQRILVPIGSPDNAGPLLDIAFYLRQPKSTEPVHVVTVVPDGPDTQKDVAAGEKTQSFAVIQAAAADVPIQPATRIDLNVANGINRAVRELRISTVVLGWTGEATTSERIFGSVLDQLLDQCAQMLLVCRIIHPVNTINRMVLLLPPLAEREDGFNFSQKELRHLADQIGASMLVLAMENSLPRVRRYMHSGPQVRPKSQGLNSWTHISAELNNLLKPDDLVVLLSAREGRLSWNPSLASMPQRLVEQFPDISCMVVYPNEQVSTTGPIDVATSESRQPMSLLNRQGILLQLSGITYERALTLLVEHGLVDQREKHRALVRQVIRAGRGYTSELSPGAVLVHVHVPDLAQPTLLLGISRDGLVFPKVRTPVHVMMVLLSPRELPHEQHLQTLTRVAHLVHKPEFVSQLQLAGSVDQVMKLLGLEDTTTVSERINA